MAAFPRAPPTGSAGQRHDALHGREQPPQPPDNALIGTSPVVEIVDDAAANMTVDD